jgi:hypothetical protein
MMHGSMNIKFRLINLPPYTVIRRDSVAVRERNFYASLSTPKPFRPATWPTQPPIQCVLELFSMGKAAGTSR